MTTPATPATPTPESLREALRKVIDPENGINIVDLGLIYDLSIEGERVCVSLTMTSPACPMGDMIMEDVERVLCAVLPPAYQPELQLVWEPPWGPERMSDAARERFGW